MDNLDNNQFAVSLKFALSIMFIVILVVPGIATMGDIFNGPDSPRLERVARTPDLGLSFSILAKLPGDLRHYIKNRFAFKDNLVTLSSRVKSEVFGTTPYTNVLPGEDGFLFLGVSEAIDFTQGVLLFDERNLQNWRNNIQRLAGRASDLGSRYEFLLTPNKHTVYFDKLPSWVNADKVKMTRADQLLAIAQDTTLPLHDLRDELRQRRQGLDTPLLYYKTDTHWNEYGASLGVRHFLSEIGLDYRPDLQPQAQKTGKGGDLARMIGQLPYLKDIPWSVEFDDEAICRYEDGREFVRNQTDPLHFDLLRCKNAFVTDSTAVIFIDSFGMSMIPAFANAFSETTFLWQYQVDYSVVEQLIPDFVIHQISERKLQSLDPEQF